MCLREMRVGRFGMVRVKIGRDLEIERYQDVLDLELEMDWDMDLVEHPDLVSSAHLQAPR